LILLSRFFPSQSKLQVYNITPYQEPILIQKNGDYVFAVCRGKGIARIHVSERNLSMENFSKLGAGISTRMKIVNDSIFVQTEKHGMQIISASSLEGGKVIKSKGEKKKSFVAEYLFSFAGLRSFDIVDNILILGSTSGIEIANLIAKVSADNTLAFFSYGIPSSFPRFRKSPSYYCLCC
jgi:hypothetical protein